MFKNKKMSSVSIELNDYIIRVLINRGVLGEAQLLELPIPVGVVQDGVIIDEMTLFEEVKNHVGKLGKKHPIRFFVPDTSVLMKQFDVPDEVEPKDLRGYVEMELGSSIHLPFQDPLVDTYDPVRGDGKAVLFAAPPDEVQKFINILLDLNLTPETADIRALSNLRLLEHLNLLQSDKTYLISDWSINELSICIYSNGVVEFLRYQSIDTDLEKWVSTQMVDGDVTFEYKEDLEDYRMIVADQVLELDRMMNFFKFSLHKGEKSVDDIVLLGDNPLLENISSFLAENFAMPIHTVNDAVIAESFPQMQAKHAALIGLALKGGNG